MAPFKQARALSIALLFLTLAAGVLIGIAWNERRSTAAPEPVEVVGPAGDARETDDTEAPGGDETAEDDERGRRRPVIYDLDLDPAQSTRVDEIVQHFMHNWEDLDEEMQRETWRRRGVMRLAVLDSIKSILRPEQLVVYDSLLAVRFSPNRGRGESRERGRRPDGSDQKEDR